ncbi:MAG: MATE family efflux transporter, partial [Kiritimatiellia bacterium]|nr:MATE family efflux transporter [Kiritimatiellia bacterium]
MRIGKTFGRASDPDLTTGSASGAILRLAWPMLIGSILQNVQSLIDLFWVGRLGPQAIASVAMGGTAIMVIFPLWMGLSTGTVAIVSRAIGAGRPRDAAHAAGQSLLLSVILGAFSGLVGMGIAEPFLKLLGAAPEIVKSGGDYLAILLYGSTTSYLLFTGNSALQGAGDTVTPMRTMLTANLINLILDPLLIFGIGPLPSLGVQGAALATVIAQFLACSISLRKLHHPDTPYRIRLSDWRPNGALCRRILRIGLPGTGQMLSRSLMNAVMMSLVAGFGTIAVAAYGTGMRFHMILLMPAFALANAAATMVGQNLGAGKPERAAHAAWIATGLYAALVFLSSAIVFIWASELIGLFSEDAAVIAVGCAYLRMVSPFYIFAAPGIILGRALNGAGDTLMPMIITV